MPYKIKRSGVYCLKIQDKMLIYIGSSNHVIQRNVLHFSALRKNDKKRAVGQLLIEYNNGSKIDFEVLEDTTDLLEREQYWINFYKDLGWTLINVFDADRNNTTVPDGFRNKMSKIRIEKWKDPNYRKTMLPKMVPTQFKSKR